MAVSHHDREEETLIAYFQQMLADVDDEEFSGEIQATSGNFDAPAPSEEATTPQSNQTVLASTNAAIAESSGSTIKSSEDSVLARGMQVEEEAQGEENPLGGIAHISTQDMLSQEISIADDTGVVDNPLAYEPQVQLQPQPKAQVVESREYAQPEHHDSLKRLLANISPEVATATETKVETVTETKVETAVAEPQVQVAEPQTQVAEPQVQIIEPQVVVTPQVQVAEPKIITSTQEATKLTKHVVKTHEQLVEERMNAKLRAINNEWKNVDLGQNFQALFFLAQGVRFAVPLIDLGGIFECDKITQLFGKPSWFMGITDVRGYKINIVDTLRWVMPEIGESPDKYPYLIALGNSQWAIGCDVLEGNRSLSADQVKWREIPGTRPWLAGIVSSNKCALLHVNALIALFNAGASIEDLVKDFEAEQKHSGKQK